MYASSVASDIRFFSFGYSDSLDKKKQYVQSILQVDPLGLASRWKPGGALVGNGSAVTGGMFASPSFGCKTVTSPALSISNLFIAAQFQCFKSFYCAAESRRLSSG